MLFQPLRYGGAQSDFVQRGRTQLKNQAAGILKRLQQDMGYILNQHISFQLWLCLQYSVQLHACQCQRMTHMIVQVGGKGTTLPFLGNGQLGGQGLEAMLILLKLLFLLPALIDFSFQWFVSAIQLLCTHIDLLFQAPVPEDKQVQDAGSPTDNHQNPL